VGIGSVFAYKFYSLGSDSINGWWVCVIL